jgi:putative transposase
VPHSYVSCHIHYVFSTKGRRKTISPEIKERLWVYMGGIARENKMKALVVGGTSDHVHIPLVLSSTISVAKAIQLIKGASSKWVSDTFPTLRQFAWQEGYGAFSVSVSGIDDTIAYIQAQDEQHRARTFEEEFLAFLKKHKIAYDERYIWG